MLVRAPGRVNLIGDHTDYTGGLVLPMAIDRYTELRARPGGHRVIIHSAQMTGTVDIPIDLSDPATVEPAWGRYVAGVVAEARPVEGLRGRLTSNIPIGAGLSSSAALEVAVALAFGHEASPLEVALLCQRAEHRASGVPSGIMDQLTIAAGVRDHALLIDCDELTVAPVRLPDDAQIAVRFVAHRTLVGSAYADRVAECARAEREIGRLRRATAADAASIADAVVRRRAQHVVGENRRVAEFAAALADGDLAAAGALMLESHASLRDLYATSTPAMDEAVDELSAAPGVYGARMTGGGFGGCVVALCDRAVGREPRTDEWIVAAVDGAHVLTDDG